MEVLIAYLIPVAFGLAVYLAFTKAPKRVDAMAVSWALAWATINLVTFTLNQFAAAKLEAAIFAVVSTALGVPAAVVLASRRDKLRMLFRAPLVPDDLRHGVGLAFCCLMVIFVALIFYKGLSIPPASTDAVVYHMRLPKVALQSGTLAAEPGTGWLEFTTSLPNLLVTQQLWVYLGAGQFDELLVRPIMPIYSSLLLLVVFSDTRRSFGILPAFLAAAGLFSLNEFASLAIVMWAEIPIAFYAYLAIRALWNSNSWGSLVVAGVFAGASALVKYNGLVVVAALGAAILLFALRSRNATSLTLVRRVGQAASRAGFFLFVAGFTVAPFLIRNALAFGNPVYPFFFGGPNTAPLAYYSEDFSTQDFVRFQVHKGIVLIGSLPIAGIAVGLLRFRQWSRAERFLCAVVLFYLPIYAYFPSAGSHVRYLAPMIPVAATLGGRQLAWWIAEANRRDQFRGSLVVAGFLGSELFLMATTDVRPEYLVQSVAVFGLLAILALLLVAMQRRLLRPTVRTVAAAALAAALLAPGFAAVAGEKYPPREAAWDIALQPPNREAYLEARFGDDWRMWQWINTNLPTDALILTFEARLLYLERNVIFAADHELDLTYSMPLDQAVAFVKGLGVQHILDSQWSHIPIVNQVFWRRSVLFQNLNNQSFFQVFHAEAGTILYALL